jgi:hypothetical protein
VPRTWPSYRSVPLTPYQGAVKASLRVYMCRAALPCAVALRSQTGLDGELARLQDRAPERWPCATPRASAGLTALHPGGQSPASDTSTRHTNIRTPAHRHTYTKPPQHSSAAPGRLSAGPSIGDQEEAKDAALGMALRRAPLARRHRLWTTSSTQRKAALSVASDLIRHGC